MDMGRRAFLRGKNPRGITVPCRPPWAMDEILFTRACTRCGACVGVCPTGLLMKGAGGFPEADFRRAHCTFCMDCVHACAENARQNTSCLPPALAFSPDLPPWTLQAAIGTACLSRQGIMCRSCEEHCETGAIRFSLRPNHPAQPDIIRSGCTGCGECVASCPSHAISMQRFSPSGLYSPPFPEESPQ